MPNIIRSSVLVAAFAATLPASFARAESVPEQIAAPGEAVVTRVHAEGAQVYECKATSAGQLMWQFREPIATLMLEGNKTVGRHYAGPNWELADGSVVQARQSGRAPGASPQDIPLLKLDVVAHRGSGQLAEVNTVQRLNTKGGTAEGACPREGALLSVPYSAEYVFLKKAP